MFSKIIKNYNQLWTARENRLLKKKKNAKHHWQLLQKEIHRDHTHQRHQVIAHTEPSQKKCYYTLLGTEIETSYGQIKTQNIKVLPEEHILFMFYSDITKLCYIFITALHTYAVFRSIPENRFRLFKINQALYDGV